jgi:hypothetical protein
MARQDITVIAIAFAIALALAIWGTTWLGPILFGNFNNPKHGRKMTQQDKAPISGRPDRQ